MDDKLKNNLFLVAVDHLFKEKLVTSQKDLAQKIGITETSLSRIKKGQRVVSDDTLRKMNEAFDFIFNMAYFRGRSTKLLIEDVNYYEQCPQEDSFHEFDRALQKQPEESSIASEPEQEPYNTIPSWAANLIDIISKQIKENEALNRELHQSIQEVNLLKTDLRTVIKNIQK